MAKSINDDELEILNLFETGALMRSLDPKGEIDLAQEAAEAYFRRDRRIQLRLSKTDLERLKMIAASEGLSYQSLMVSILHKFANSHIPGSQTTSHSH